ncbi:hypothetical protein ACFFK0_09610 [Paenibacillus chartarius]|uniref:Uncharacterized protein n=1 Tax=Paenibacillus chartarius TaxID=747481 RepID=A0ABV6DJ96_9BACL
MTSIRTLRDRIRDKLSQWTSGGNREPACLDEPEQELEDEIVQNLALIELAEQLTMIRIADRYMNEFVLHEMKIPADLQKGFALQNQIFVTTGTETVFRANLDYFFQDQNNLRHIHYVVSLIRFADDAWRVFQVKNKLDG